jgi:hypothetical protein
MKPGTGDITNNIGKDLDLKELQADELSQGKMLNTSNPKKLRLE